MRSIIGLVVAIVCKRFALAWTWFRTRGSDNGKHGRPCNSTPTRRRQPKVSMPGIYSWVNQFVGKGRRWVEWIDGRRFHCAVHRSVTGQVVLTVDFPPANICSSFVLEFQDLHAANPGCQNDVDEFFHDKYGEMIDECLDLYGVQVDQLCERLFYETD